MIRCLQIIGSRGGGGAENFYVHLAGALAAGGAEVTAVHPRGAVVCAALGPGVAHIHLPMWSVLDLYSRWRIGRLARAQAPVVVQTYMGRATRLTRLPRRPGLVHVARLGGFYALRHYRHAQAWVGNTRAICDHLRQAGFPAERVFHIGNFAPAPPPVAVAEREALRAELGLPPDARVAVVVARLHENKGLPDLLQALPAAQAQLGARPLRLVCVGDGPLRETLHRQAQALGVAAQVVWTGWRDAPWRYLALADLAVCPSRHEPLGNVILEAWAAGKPILSTRTHGGEELITHGRDGWLVPVRDPAALAGALATLLLDDALRLTLAQGGAATLAQRHAPAAVVGAYRDLYRAALEWPA